MRERAAIAGLVVVLLAASAFVLWPFASWILITLWAAVLIRPMHARLALRLGRRPRLAAVLATLALVLLVTPVIVLLASLVDDAVDLVRDVLATDRVQALLGQAPAQAGAPGGGRGGGLVGLAISQGGRAWTIAQGVAGTAAHAVLGLVIAIWGIYSVLVDGARWSAWLEAHAPMSPEAFRRLAGATIETGRGLFFGILGAGFAQAVVATAFYVGLGVPQALALGALTLACSIVPAIGTAMVWLPVALALWLGDRPTAAIVMFAGGVLVIGTIDNFVRPYLARKGHLQLPTFVVALAMFGGIAALGARGVLLGPLVVRLAKEVLAIAREDRAPPPG
jgi:predicted PurR-regulated permease PerM